MLDFDRDVISKRREFTVHLPNDAHAMRGTVKKVRIPERDVLCSGFHLLPYVREDNISRNHAKMAVIHRHDRAVAAEMFTAAARLRVPGDAFRYAIEHPGITGQGRQPGPVWYRKGQPFE